MVKIFSKLQNSIIYNFPPSSPTPVEMFALDTYGNVANLNETVHLGIINLNESSGEHITLPELEKSCRSLRIKAGKLNIPRIVLRERVGNKIGYYGLTFSCAALKKVQVKFAFSTSKSLSSFAMIIYMFV